MGLPFLCGGPLLVKGKHRLPGCHCTAAHCAYVPCDPWQWRKAAILITFLCRLLGVQARVFACRRKTNRTKVVRTFN